MISGVHEKLNVSVRVRPQAARSHTRFDECVQGTYEQVSDPRAKNSSTKTRADARIKTTRVGLTILLALRSGETFTRIFSRLQTLTYTTRTLQNSAKTRGKRLKVSYEQPIAFGSGRCVCTSPEPKSRGRFRARYIFAWFGLSFFY